MNDKDVSESILAIGAGFVPVDDEESADATSRKLLRKLEEIELKLRSLDYEHQAITTALRIAGILPEE